MSPRRHAPLKRATLPETVAQALRAAETRGYLYVSGLAAATARAVEQAHCAWCAARRMPCVKIVSKRGVGDLVTLDLFPTGYAASFNQQPQIDVCYVDEIARAVAAYSGDIDGAGHVIIAALGPITVLYGVLTPEASEQLALKLGDISARWSAAYRDGWSREAVTRSGPLGNQIIR